MPKSTSLDKNRQLIVFECAHIPSPGFLEMYVNPSSFNKKYQKLQQKVRTKGGYILQYWGEELETITLAGSVGNGGIEAIQVLEDIYRSEQLALRDILINSDPLIKQRQSLGQMAASCVMWYGGQGHRGFFESFDYSEKPAGDIDYNMTFTVVETIGKRANYMPWSRRPNSTTENFSTESGNRQLDSGAYGTNYKMGEMNAPAYNSQTGKVSDGKFVNQTGERMDVGSNADREARKNLANNKFPINGRDLFSK